MDTVILDPVIPYVGPIGGGSFTPKKLVKLEGTIPPHPYGFDINFQCGPNTYPHDDIALQISVRFLNGYISLNSSQQGTWGKEIRLSNVPIQADQKFKITVLCEFNQYKVAINDEHYCIFPQRIRCEKVSHLSIDGDVSITRISNESICNLISDSRTPLAPTINQFNNVQHSDLPPSYDTAINSSEDVESQNERVAHIAIFHFQYNRDSPLKATLKKGCKTFFIFLCVIAVTILFGYLTFLIAQYASNDTGDTSYSTYGIPSIDFTAVDEDMEKNLKVANDAIESSKKIDEENKKFDDIFAKAKKMDEDNKDYFDLVRKSILKVKNNDIYGFVRTPPDHTAEENKKVSNVLAKIKKRREDLLQTSNQKAREKLRTNND